jgi:hypothetical protein
MAAGAKRFFIERESRRRTGIEIPLTNDPSAALFD